MTELEKIIKELAQIREDHFGGMTSYEGEVLDAALALPKAQGPRVVKIYELTSGEPMLVWLEDIDKEETVAGMIFDYVPGRLGFKLTDLASRDRIYPRIEDYLARWRCWTSRPDEKRRAEVPWES